MTARASMFVIAALAVMLIACGWWSVRPLPPAESASVIVARAMSERDAAPTSTTATARDDAAFRLPIWVAPPPEEPPPPETPPPQKPPPLPRLDLQIVAILRGEPMRAVAYDPSADALRTLVVGDELPHGRTIESIDDNGITIRDREGVHRIQTQPASSKESGRGGAP
ncbi:MAG: hypothetical protein RBS39_06600 [Phycisphaerales bacterium]|jgi:hypothetical protein|nr:hypothetical protein [Phycisphaerales bacterium]